MSIVPNRSSGSVDEGLDLVELADVGRDGEARATADFDLALHCGEWLLALAADHDVTLRCGQARALSPRRSPCRRP